MIKIIGGAKTGYNLYKYLGKKDIDCELFFFKNEFSEKKGIGSPFATISHLDSTNCIITSETALNNIPLENRTSLRNHYYLRNKLNIPVIADALNCGSIKQLNSSDIETFPVILKPKESMAGKVPFKIRLVKNREEMKELEDMIEDCIIQPYLDPQEYNQIAIAGYFEGSAHSMIAVEQKNQYPIGISAYVVNRTSLFQDIIVSVSKFLNSVGYRGFIEFEFKQSKKNNELYLMDINPRTWGWFYFYLDGIENFKEVLFHQAPIELNMKKAWINTPRLIFANLKGRFVNPTVGEVLNNDICYEPYFRK